MGVQEMTRFGMKEDDFAPLAEYMAEVILKNRPMAKEVSQLRKRFTEMKYCLPEAEARSMVERLLEAIIGKNA
jgi:glycine/serine hydroxymethyltransferase